VCGPPSPLSRPNHSSNESLFQLPPTSSRALAPPHARISHLLTRGHGTTSSHRCVRRSCEVGHSGGDMSLSTWSEVRTDALFISRARASLTIAIKPCLSASHICNGSALWYKLAYGLFNYSGSSVRLGTSCMPGTGGCSFTPLYGEPSKQSLDQ
jgi:hypothetical protein